MTNNEVTTIVAEHEETLYDFIGRAMWKANVLREEVMADHNGVSVRVYCGSNAYDILDKFAMQRMIDRMNGK